MYLIPINSIQQHLVCPVQAHGEPGDFMLSDIEDDPVQPVQPSAHQLLQLQGTANKPLPFPQAQAANQQRPTGRPAALAKAEETQAFRFPAMYEGKEGGTPAIDLPERTWGMQHPGKLPTPTSQHYKLMLTECLHHSQHEMELRQPRLLDVDNQCPQLCST